MRENKKTPYPQLDIVLNGLANRLESVLGNNFVGFYLQGSLALGDFDFTSDVDFIVVINEDLSDEQVEAVQKVHSETYVQDNRWVKRMEYSFFPKDKLSQQSSPFSNGERNEIDDRKLWYFDNGSQTIEKSDHCNTLVTRWTLREKGITLKGPDPKTLLEPIGPKDLRQEIKDTMIGWGEDIAKLSEPFKNRFYQSYLVLNYARMLHNLHEARIDSKLKAVIWAKSNLDSKWFSLIDYCWKERQDTSISVKQPAVDEVFEKSLEFVKYVVELAKSYKIPS